MLNSCGEWQPYPELLEQPLGKINVGRTSRLSPSAALNSGTEEPGSETGGATVLRSVLNEPAALEKVGQGPLVVLEETDGQKTYGRAMTVAERLRHERVIITKWIRRLTNWNGRQAPMDLWKSKIVPLVEQRFAQQKTPVVRFVNQQHHILAYVSLAELTMRVPVDKHGVALWKPVLREVLPYDCAQCSLVETCKKLVTATGTALLWRRLGLVDQEGVPTLRGRVVAFLDLGTAFNSYEAECLESIRASGAKGSFILGPNTVEFEKEFASYVGVKHAIGVANGTDSLYLSLRALGIGPGDEVITTPWTFFASAESVSMVGATPVFVDIRPDTFCLDPESIDKRLTPKTKAILPVHIFGHACDMDAIMQIARDRKLAVLEDCAQSFGARWGGKVTGSIGDARYSDPNYSDPTQ